MRSPFAILVSITVFGLGWFAAELPFPGRTDNAVLVAESDQGAPGSAEDIEIGEAAIPGPLREFRLAAVATARSETPAEAGDPGLDRYVTGDRVALRSGPNVRSRLLRRLDTGTRLIEVDRQNAWIRLRVEDGTEGWMHRSFVAETDPAATPNG